MIFFQIWKLFLKLTNFLKIHELFPDTKTFVEFGNFYRGFFGTTNGFLCGDQATHVQAADDQEQWGKGYWSTIRLASGWAKQLSKRSRGDMACDYVPPIASPMGGSPTGSRYWPAQWRHGLVMLFSHVFKKIVNTYITKTNKLIFQNVFNAH